MGVELATTDIFITHLHLDHSGLIGRLKRPTNQVFASQVDKQLLEEFFKGDYWEWRNESNLWAGTPAEFCLPQTEKSTFVTRPSQIVPITGLELGATLRYGEHQLEVLDLAGHTPGQVGLWDKEREWLFSADHILNRVSPNISTWDLSSDYLGIYLTNLAKVRAMSLQRIFTAHFSPVDDYQQRIDELVSHHHQRLSEILAIIQERNEGTTAFQVANQMTWLGGKKLSEIPKQQCWFACTEVLAHLQTLVFSGELKATQKEQTLYFSTK